MDTTPKTPRERLEAFEAWTETLGAALSRLATSFEAYLATRPSDDRLPLPDRRMRDAANAANAAFAVLRDRPVKDLGALREYVISSEGGGSIGGGGIVLS
jgi:hypothetical protein